MKRLLSLLVALAIGWLTMRSVASASLIEHAAPKSNGVRIDQGSPGPIYPSQQVDHVIVRSGGNVLGPDGVPIVGSIKQNPQAHIPLDDWLSWSSWNAP